MTRDPEFYTEPELVAKEENLNKLVEQVRQKIHEKQAAGFAFPPRTDDDFLVKFIRCKKYEPDEAIKAIEKYYKNICTLFDLAHDKYPQDFESIYKAKPVSLLRHRVHGRFVTLLHAGSWNPNIHTFEDILVSTGFYLEEMWKDKYQQLNGFTPIWDISGFSLCHVRILTYHNVKLIAKCLLEMYPMRVQAIHLINFPRIFWPLYLLVMKIIPKKLKSRVYLHKNVASLAQALDHQALPVSLGGILTEDEAWDTEMLAKLLKENKSYDSRWNATSDS